MMPTIPGTPEGPWVWARLGQCPMLVTKHGGSEVVLIATADRIQTCNDKGFLRDITPDSPLAHAIAAIPELMAAVDHVLRRAQTDADFAYHLCSLTESFRLLCIAEAACSGEDIEAVRERRSAWLGQGDRTAREARLRKLRDLVGELINEWDQIGSPSRDEEEIRDEIREQFDACR